MVRVKLGGDEGRVSKTSAPVSERRSTGGVYDVTFLPGKIRGDYESVRTHLRSKCTDPNLRWNREVVCMQMCRKW